VKVRRSVFISALSLTAVLAALSLTAVLAAQTAAPEGTASSSHHSGQSPGAGAVPRDSLRALASRVGLRIGTAVNTDALATNATYRQITADQFSTVTPENVMKWQLVEPTKGTYDWSAADQLVEFAQAHGQLVHGHVLVWHSQLPDWLTTGNYTPAQLRDLLRKHISDEVSHFRGHIWQWDVVNEAFNDDGTMRDTLWLRALGPGYIADAFRWAHRADPHALLLYNDYNIEGLGAKSDAVYELVKQLRAQGVPIDGVGLQTHLDTQYGFPDQMQQNMQRFADLGLKLALTEVDVRSTLPVTSTVQLAQNADYSQSLQACLLVRQCISYTVWGFGDAYSWVPGVFAGQGAADIYDENLQPKPSYYALQQNLILDTGAPHRDGTGVTLKLSGLTSGSVKLGKSVMVKGTVTPTSLAGSKVTLTVQKKKGAKWLTVESVARTISASGAYSWKYTPGKRGAYRMRATIARTTAHAAAGTAWRPFKVT